MSLGPVELLLIKFPGNQFKGEIVPALEELITTNTIRVLDILFLKKDSAGDLTLVEISEIEEDEVYDAFDPLVPEVEGFLSESDALLLAQSLEPNSSAALMLFENVWATRFRDAVVNANGQVLLNERIPRQVIDTLIAEQLQANAS
ncbi:hypothetical protein IQ254_13050 [Nodosilinea sp. LEGE 07088]|uniref:DUF6325 family protein n=1 Tax=Nodosilinea sp. LEGE 07088 TaxID=2777968 RepID=UPI0018822CF4|nr:DUF6325 family protein [Nodosilinea sp. LEGE 07088]MBE9138102.1 hypothetical protein [Nodosilinea sp. LEGE 07088]